MALLTEGYSLETRPTIDAVRASLLQNMKGSMGRVQAMELHASTVREDSFATAGTGAGQAGQTCDSLSFCC